MLGFSLLMCNTDFCQIKIIDSHTGGEPTRVVTDLPSEVTGLDTGSMMERRLLMAENYDWIRTSCLLEPRGHDAMVGVLLCEPVNPDCAAGVIFFNNVGYLSSCIHGTIGVTVTLAHMGKISTGKHRIETPIGEVIAELHDDGSVTVTNVPSYRYQKNVSVDVPGYGTVTGDVAWGGNWFFLTENYEDKIAYENIAPLTAFSSAVAQALADQNIVGDDGAAVDHIEVFGAPTPGVSDSRSFVLCPGLAYDRSPCGTGTSAKLACLHADGKLAPSQVWRQASVLDTVFEGRVKPLENDQVTPMITGTAFVNGEATIIIQNPDPFKHGIKAT
ncbi:MAG: proline racemase family protein [Akkermansiaceae bacterium]